VHQWRAASWSGSKVQSPAKKQGPTNWAATLSPMPPTSEPGAPFDEFFEFCMDPDFVFLL